MYKPAFSDGRLVKLPWQIRTLHLIITWPLDEKPAIWVQILSGLSICWATAVYTYVEEGEVLFIVTNFSNINLSVEALATCIVLNESFLRIFGSALTRNSFKVFMKEFFGTIYIDEEESPTMWKKIQQELLPTRLFTYSYMIALSSFLIEPLLKLRRHERSLPYKMILHYSLENTFVYGFTQIYLIWLGLNIVLFFIGDGFLLASCILHLNARYTMLQEELQQCGSILVSTVSKAKIASEFRRKIVKIYVQICDLNRFADIFNHTFSFRIFIMIAFSAVLLCVLCFQVSSLGATSENIAYASWIVAKVSELLIFGALGSTLEQTTDLVSTSYYMSNWEEIIYRSTNKKENIRLMRDLQIIMSLHNKPVKLSGFSFFYVSLDTTVKVLRGAFSYFTCLYTMKQTAGN